MTAAEDFDEALQQRAERLARLSEDELRQACRARGMRAPFGDGAAEYMRQQLAEWLDWSLNRCGGGPGRADGGGSAVKSLHHASHP